MKYVSFPSRSLEAALLVFKFSLFLLKTFLNGINKNKEDCYHMLSNRVCLENILSAV
jgi:hypothetical protein